MIWALICPLMALLIGIVSDQVREVIQAFCEKLSGVIEGLYHFAQNALKKIIAWLKLTETPRPDLSFWGLLLLAIAVLASIAEYRISRRTVTVIFPWGEEAPMLAFALVALTAATGILAHRKDGGVRRAALVLAVLLIVTQGLLANRRAIETLAAEEMSNELTLDINSGGLIIDGADGQVNDDFPTSTTETARSHPNWRTGFHPTVLLATLTAVLFSTAAVITFWGGARLGGSALTWFIGGMGIVVWAVPTAFLFVLHLIVEQNRLTRAILAITDAILAICRLPLRAIAWLRYVFSRERKRDQNLAETRYAVKTEHEKNIADSEHAHQRAMQQLRFQQEREPLENQISFNRARNKARLEMQQNNLNLMHEVSSKTAETLKAEFDAEVVARAPRYIAHIATVILDYILSLFQQRLSEEDSVQGSGAVLRKTSKRKESTDEFQHDSTVDAPASAD